MFDLILTGGYVADGLGRPPYAADVAISEGRICGVGDLSQAQANRSIDCTGRCISPGWVDIHSHSDDNVLDYSIGLNLLIQGCTLTVAGNCGASPAPTLGRAVQRLASGERSNVVKSSLWQMQLRYPEATWSMADFLHEVEGAQPGINYVQLVGHGQLRRCVMGDDPRAATEGEVKQMAALLEHALEEGAFGMSSGLVYRPGCWCETGELIELGRIVSRYGGVYTSHVRGERETSLEAIREFIQIAETSGVRAQVSHMHSKYPGYGNGATKVELLKQARDRGIDVACDTDVFPNYAETPVTLLGHTYHLSDEQFMEKLRSARGRAELKQLIRTLDPWRPDGRTGTGGVPFRRAWDRVTIYDCPRDRSLEGRSVAAAAVARGVDFEDVLFDLALAEDGQGPLLVHAYIEDDHYRTAPWECAIFPSLDTGLFDPAADNSGHALRERFTPLDLRYILDTGYPGTIGLFARVLGQFVREEKLMTLEEGVRRMTSLAMQRLGITDRGIVRTGMWADLVVFDKDTIALRSPDADPARLESFYPVGIDYVLVNGEVAIQGHTYTGARAGHVLRRR